MHDRKGRFNSNGMLQKSLCGGDIVRVIKNEEEGLTEQSKKGCLLQAVGPWNKHLGPERTQQLLSLVVDLVVERRMWQKLCLGGQWDQVEDSPEPGLEPENNMSPESTWQMKFKTPGSILQLPGGRDGQGAWDGHMYTLLYLKWITNKDLLCSTGNSVQCYVAA